MPPYVLILHGLAGADADHWQGWLAGELANRGATVDVPRFSDPDRPVLDVWLTELREHLELAARDVERVVLAHAGGAALWLHHAATLKDTHEDHLVRFGRALLVALPGPQWHPAGAGGFTPVPLDAAGVRRATATTRLVWGEDDPTCSPDEARHHARTLRLDSDVIPGGGHLDAGSGYGPWPSVLEWVLTGRVPIVARGG